MKQYRAQLKSGRVIGPLSSEQLGELYRKGHIKGDELFAEFPSTNWNKIGAFPDLRLLIQSSILGDNSEQTKVFFELKKFKSKKEDQQLEDEKEKQKQKKLGEEEPQLLEKKQEEQEKESAPSILEMSQEVLSHVELLPEEKLVLDNEKKMTRTHLKQDKQGEQDNLELERTKIIRNVRTDADEIEKTVIVKSMKIDEDEEKNENENKTNPENEEVKSSINKKNQELVVTSKDETRLVNLDESVLKSNEIAQFEQEILLLEKKVQASASTSSTNAPEKKIEIEVVATKKSRKGMRPIAAFAMVVVFYFLLFDEEKQDDRIKPTLPIIIYPSLLVKSDYKEAVKYYEKAKPLMTSYRYESKLVAAENLRRSYELYKDDNVLSQLLLVYVDLLPHVVIMDTASDLNKKFNKYALRQQCGNVILKMIKDLELRRMSDLNLVLASSLFYYQEKKYKAALNVLIKYQVGGGKIDSPRYYVVMLKILDAIPLKDIAGGVYEHLASNINNPGLELLISLARHSILNKDYDKAETLLVEGRKRFADSVELLTELSGVLLFKEDMTALKDVLLNIKNLNAESSGLYYAKYLEYMGMMSAYNKNLKQATFFLSLSLAINESPQLRAKLADLQDSNNPQTSRLIQESKVFDLMQKSMEFKDKNDWDKAMLYAIDAVDVEGASSLDAALYLAKLETQRGHYNEALENLKKLHDRYPRVDEVTFSLTSAYIDAYNFKDAMILLSNSYSTANVKNPRYNFIMSYLNIKSNNYLAANVWLKKSMEVDPLNDQVYYFYAQNLLKFKKYNSAMYQLIKAIDLDPSNVEYRVLYAQILYNQKGIDAAIGYLNELLQEKIYRFNDEEKQASSATEPSNSTDSDSDVDASATKAEDTGKNKLTVTSIIRQLGRMTKEDAVVLISEIAIYYHYSGQFKIFEKYRNKLEKEYNGSKVFYRFMAKVGKMEDRPQDFINYSQKLITIDPGNIEAKVDLAEFLVREGRPDEAIAILEEVTKRLESYPKLYYYLSRIYLLKNNDEKALQMAEKEIAFNPNLEFGYLQQGEIFLGRKDYNKARQAYKFAQAKNAKSTDALLGLAKLAVMENHYETALDLYLQVAKDDPYNSSIKRDLGNTYKALGQSGLAIQSFKEYLEMRPDAEDKAEIEEAIRKLQ